MNHSDSPAVSAITPVEEQFKCEGCGREYTRESWSTITLCGQCFHYSKLEDRIDVLTAENARLEARLAALLSSDRAVQLVKLARQAADHNHHQHFEMHSSGDDHNPQYAECQHPDCVLVRMALPSSAAHPETCQGVIVEDGAVVCQCEHGHDGLCGFAAQEEEWIARFNKLPEIVHRAEERTKAKLASDRAVKEPDTEEVKDDDLTRVHSMDQVTHSPTASSNEVE